jgi:Flagellar hook-length control protein FliK
MGSLSAGDVLAGRVVELLPQNQALISLRGQNVVAQLPAGNALAKGEILSLQVSQVSPGEGSTAASLVLKLAAPPPGAGTPSAQAQASPGSVSTTPGFSQLEQALGAARLPVNSVNLALAQTLSRLGAPLDAQTLQTLSRSVESLISNEGAQTAQNPGSVLEDRAVQQVLQEGLALAKGAAQMSQSSEQAVILMQAARSLEGALQDGANPPADAFPASSAADSGRNWSLAIEQSVQRFLDDPTLARAQDLDAVLSQASQSAAPSEGSGPASLAPSIAAVSAGAAEVPDSPLPDAPPGPSFSSALALNSALPVNSADIPAMREALAQWLGPMNQSATPLTAGSLSGSARSLAAAFSSETLGPTQRLIAAVQAQSPQSSPEAIQGAAVRALQQAADFYGQLSAGRSVPGVQAVQSDLRSQGLPVPAADLATLAPETVASAVAWLNARGLPPQRPLVETVAAWMDQDRSAMPAAQKALQGQDILAETLDTRPSLKQAYEALGQALQSAGMDPESDGLAGHLQAWASAQGLTLESDLAAGSSGVPVPEAAPGAPSGAVTSPDARGGSSSLRGSLLRLQNELSQALQSTQAASSVDAEGLNSALRDAQAAVRGFNALPLQSQGAPSFDTVHLPMPVWMNGALGDGRLSVTWRQGRERELDDKDPVNVAVTLNTESLGPVTVTLQVWKNAASARVLAQDKETAAFLAQGADELRAGFSENTPFALNSLDFSAESAPAPAGFRGPGEPEAPSLGLSLRA